MGNIVGGVDVSETPNSAVGRKELNEEGLCFLEGDKDAAGNWNGNPLGKFFRQFINVMAECYIYLNKSGESKPKYHLLVMTNVE